MLLRFIPVLMVCGCLGAAKAAERPNILYCLADDWSYPHAGTYGDKAARTPTFDRLAKDGMLFTHCFSAAPSCTPSRAAMLTGQYPHRLEQGGVLWGFLPKKFKVYPDLLEKSGYTVGMTRKGWGPGDFRAGGFDRNPAGPVFRNFAEFLETTQRDKPFCFWFGATDPHRPYENGSGVSAGFDPGKVRVPPFWPDTQVTRNDVLDYYAEVERFDREVGEAMALLEAAGQLENTIVLMTGDNGWPFPRCKANLYDGGTRQPLAVRWPKGVRGGQVCEDFINLMDLAPTFLEVAGLAPLPEMTGRSFLPLLTGTEACGSRDVVFLERERHANVRAGDAGYPIRAVRTREFLYIRNFHPERWPAGDPKAHKDPKRSFGDVDDGPTKGLILERRSEPEMRKFFEMCFDKRPSEELYDLKKDPDQVLNVADKTAYQEPLKKLRAKLAAWMKDSRDPRATSDADVWDTYPYYGGQPVRPEQKKAPGKSRE